jgi:hypothetical protein
VLIMSEERANQLGLTPRARFHTFALAGVDPVTMLTGPIPATTKAFERSGLTMADMDVIEINEAFASVVLAWEKEHDPDMSKVNINGGAIALGHPLGGSGTKLMATMLNELERTRRPLRPPDDVRGRRASPTPPSSSASRRIPCGARTRRARTSRTTSMRGPSHGTALLAPAALGAPAVASRGARHAVQRGGRPRRRVPDLQGRLRHARAGWPDRCPEPPPPGEMRKVKLRYRCSLCGLELRIDQAIDEDPPPLATAWRTWTSRSRSTSYALPGTHPQPVDDLGEDHTVVICRSLAVARGPHVSGTAWRDEAGRDGGEATEQVAVVGAPRAARRGSSR